MHIHTSHFREVLIQLMSLKLVFSHYYLGVFWLQEESVIPV